MLLNSDVEVTEHWLRPMADYLDAHPEVAACQPKIRSWRQKQMFEYAGAAGGFIDCYGYPYCRGRVMEVVEEDKGQYDTVRPVFWATGAALFIRLKDYQETGRPRCPFFCPHGGNRLVLAPAGEGQGTGLYTSKCGLPCGGATLKKGSPRKTYLNFRNNLLMLYKNLPESELLQRHACPLLARLCGSSQLFVEGAGGPMHVRWCVPVAILLLRKLSLHRRVP